MIIENIVLYNGQTVIIGSNRDIADTAKLYAEERAATDADSYLSSLESAETCLRDVLEVLEELQEYMEEVKRINKDVIYGKNVKNLQGKIWTIIMLQLFLLHLMNTVNRSHMAMPWAECLIWKLSERKYIGTFQ